jgi:Ni/Co efflux regulator RcnB
LSLSILAASVALIPAAAFAQAGHRQGPPAGHSWRGGVQGQGMTMRHRGMRGMHPGRQFRGHRFQRGFVIPQFWFGPQFHVQNWQVYGFADPGRDGRWVRFYDDAYMIDREGRVRDHRYGMDWDQYGEEWEVADGIPAYRGSRDYHPGDADYDYAERQGESHHGGAGHAMHGGQVMHGGSGYGYGHGAAYGGYYGYGAYAYPIVIETVTTHGCGCSYEVVEEVVEVRQRQRRRPPPRPRPPRRPPPGERG